MSLFKDLTDLSKQHAENSGSYTFEKPAEPEPAPSVSLYNLLDHSEEDLNFLWDCVSIMETKIRPHKLSMSESYMKCASWMTIIAGAIREKKDRDSEQWAEKTAKEINETL
jgi:hypothetical protein